MEASALINCLFDDPACGKIRIDPRTNSISVLDVIQRITGYESNNASTVLNRLGSDLIVPCKQIKINNRGRPTPVADVTTLLAIIRTLPGAKAKIFRSTMVQRLEQLAPNDTPYDFGFGALGGLGVIQLGAITAQPSVKMRDVLMIGKVKCTIPFDDDLPEVKEQFARLAAKAEELYIDEQRTLSNLRLFRDIGSASVAIEDQPSLISHVDSVAKIVRKIPKPRARIQSHEEAIKSRPCALSTCNLSHVYIITQRGTNMFKIGVSERPHQRLAALQTANPIKLEIVKMFHGTRQDEQFLHRIYKEYQTTASNEWFAFRDGDCYLL